MGGVQQIIEFSQFSVVNAKFRRELWIYKIMTSVFDTHPPLIYVTISSVKEIRFWNRYPPTFYVDVIKYAFFYGFPKSLEMSYQNLSPSNVRLNWSPIKHWNVGPTIMPKEVILLSKKLCSKKRRMSTF